MSIQRRLAISITLVLLFSLAIGFGLTYEHVLSKVRTEMQAALTVGVSAAQNSLDQFDEDRDAPSDPGRTLRRVVAGFNGDRHLTAILAAPDGTVIAQSRLLMPDEAAPAWFYRLVVSRQTSRQLPLSGPLRRSGTLTLETDPHNEVAEAWSDASLTLLIMALFFAMVLALAFVTIRAALAPLRDVCDALLRIGAGDYSARLQPHLSRELAPLGDGFNAMAARLEEMSVQNRVLNEQIINLQEEERAELARDLHDDVAPFLFAVGADAAMIRQYLAKDAIADVGPRAEAIADAVKHMQRHLKDVPAAVSPPAPCSTLAWPAPSIIWSASGRCGGRWSSSASMYTVIRSTRRSTPSPSRVVQESFSNAIRHGQPRTIDAVIEVDEDRATIVVEDDGIGFPDGPLPIGFGLAGMQERVRSAGGAIQIRNRTGSRRGVIVEATLPLHPKRQPEEIDRDDDRRRDEIRKMDMSA